MDRPKMSPGVIVVIVVAVLVLGVAVMFVAGIFSAVAVPSLLQARISGNEASTMGSLRAISSAQSIYTSSCALGGYAVSLEDLAKPPTGGGEPFISPDLATNGVTKSGYRLTLARGAAPGVTDVGTAAATCNGSGNTPASAFFASAEPETPDVTGVLYFAVDERGLVFSSKRPIGNPIVESPEVMPIR